MNFNPGDILTPRYDLYLVAFSYVVSVLGSLVALEAARFISGANQKTDWRMVSAAAFALGGIGVWMMHFTGMVAYRLPVPITYDVGLTLVSLVAAILISGVALYFAGGRGGFRVGGWVFGSILTGLGVCVMHYMGMYAQVMRATLAWNYTTVGISVVIAVAAAGAALWLAFNLRSFVLRVMAAFVMGLAVCAMHYTGMAAAQVICTAAAPTGRWTIAGLELWVLTLGGIALVVIATRVANRSLGARYLTAQAEPVKA
jgi:NO-binding membrane sensor protein with MHYT domain